MLEGFPERCSDVHRSDIHDGVFVAHFYTAIYTCGATFHPHRQMKNGKEIIDEIQKVFSNFKDYIENGISEAMVDEQF